MNFVNLLCCIQNCQEERHGKWCSVCEKHCEKKTFSILCGNRIHNLTTCAKTHKFENKKCNWNIHDQALNTFPKNFKKRYED